MALYAQRQAFAFLQRGSVTFYQAEDGEGYIWMLLEDTRGKAFVIAPKDPMAAVHLYGLLGILPGLYAGKVNWNSRVLYGLQVLRPKVG
jgi:hypothetical protein